MRSTCGIALAALLAIAAGGTAAEAQGAGAPAKQECAAIGLFLLDLDAKVVTVVPQRLELTYSAVPPNEICFAWFVVKGTKSKQVKKFKLKDFMDLKGQGGKPVLKEKRVHAGDLDLVSLVFDDKPKWDADGDGIEELRLVKEVYGAEFEYDGQTFTIDPEIIIQKPGG
jgi:hypothetical protein